MLVSSLLTLAKTALVVFVCAGGPLCKMIP